MRIASSGVLARCSPRSPWYQARTRTIGRPIRAASSATWRSCGGPLEGVADVLQALEESPASSDVDQSPLDDLAAAQPGPGVLGSTLCRRVGHSTAPISRGSVAASDPVAGVIALEASGITAWARCNPAAAVAGSERESASWESGNLGSCRAFADSQVARIPDFQFLAPAATSAGATGGGGGAAAWRIGNLELRKSARHGVGWVDTGRLLPGVAASGALGGRPWPPPWPGAARPSRREGSEFGTQERSIFGMHRSKGRA